MILAEQIIVRPEGPETNAAILDGIDCRFEPGTVTLLVGRTGSGKTTLLHALAGIVPPAGGSLRYGTEPLWKNGRMNDAVKHKVSLAFQYPERQLFAETLRKEFRYSLRPFRLSKDEIERRAATGLEQMKLPASLIERSVLTLSEGQKRRAAFAVTLAEQPEWLLLDEPTAGIDPSAVPPLLNAVKEHVRRGGGAVIASHDLDTFFPVADRVIVLYEGRIVAVRRPDELMSDPQPLLQARVGLPASSRIERELRKLGVCLRGAPLLPGDAAEAIHLALLERQQGAFVPDAPDMELYSAAALEPENLSGAVPQQDAPTPARLAGLNPLTKWWFYLLASTGMLIQSHVIGLAAAAAVAFACVRLSGVHARTLIKPLKPFAMFMLLSCFLSGLQLNFGGGSPLWQRYGFSWADSSRTLVQLTVLLLVMLMGILFAKVTGPREMRTGMEQGLSRLRRFRVPVGAVTLYTALLLRFIPLLHREIERMSLIIRARGKVHVKPGSIRLRDMPAFMIPLLLSMMKHAEELAMVLEARGYRLQAGNAGSAEASAPLTSADRKVRFAAVALLLLFILIDLLQL
ncbi:ATP-binding cassette domain-containing protein [Paenibacillus filicis]|uniref:ATP-binding cassette domain-containing protein n=1 Tax=Paenibacillus gyeongsangnamensis TaxID=3388067 RepID=A0ABT4QBE4_9BACL|nr:ATP-binding cassette domain-containing protein [Paenibacillus filicis]MCZ8514208.1 ATP-binding cassette domain-containing protein [Paenibacillus filicis]